MSRKNMSEERRFELISQTKPQSTENKCPICGKDESTAGDDGCGHE